MVVENFAVLPVEEQIKFAKDLIEKINLGNTFTDETNFELQGVEPDDVTGGLWVSVSLANPISIKREATWEAGDEDGAYEDPGRDAEYSSTIEDDAKKSFKTLAAAVDGYNVSLQIDDIDEDDSVDAEVEVENISNEDSGIGSYEYFGFTGYDSQPYVAVTGTITRYCDCAVTFYIEPADEI
jgi:hypothetical protein